MKLGYAEKKVLRKLVELGGIAYGMTEFLYRVYDRITKKYYKYAIARMYRLEEKKLIDIRGHYGKKVIIITKNGLDYVLKKMPDVVITSNTLHNMELNIII